MRAFDSSFFKTYFAAEVASVLGGQVTLLALPTLAIIASGAAPFEIGIVYALGYVPSILLGLPIGIAADRLDRRRLLVGADFIRALAAGSIAFAWITTHTIAIGHLYLAAVAIGLGTAIDEILAQAALPTLLGAPALADGNSKLALIRSLGQVFGVPLAGFIIQVIGAALSMISDALLSLASATLLLSIPRTRLTPTFARETRASWRSDLREGLRATNQGQLRRILLMITVLNVGGSMIGSIFLVYAYRSLGLGPGAIGLVLAGGGIGAVVASMLAPRVLARLGMDRTLRLSAVFAGNALWLIPLASIVYAPVVLVVYECVFSASATLFVIAQLTWRQIAMPPELLGRVASVVRAVGVGTLPVGAVLGGVFGSLVGVLSTIVFGAAVSSVGSAMVAATWTSTDPRR